MITHNNFRIGDFNGKLRLHTKSVTELNMKYELNVPLQFDLFSSNFWWDSIKIFRKSKGIFYLPKNILVKKLPESTVVFHASQAA